MVKPRLLLAEDYGYLRREYSFYLRQKGFRVREICDGKSFYDILKWKRYDLIVSDTDMPFMSGDEVCKRALEEKLIDKNVLIIGMSDDKYNQDFWRGIANIGCFYSKANLTEGRIAERVLQAWNNFNQGAGWRNKIPLLE